MSQNSTSVTGENNNMRVLALAIAAVAGFLVINRWDTPEAVAWTVAFCGWLPHAFNQDQETHDGHQT